MEKNSFLISANSIFMTIMPFLSFYENQHLDLKKNDWIRDRYKEHFGRKEFVVVADRRFHHTLDLNI